MYQLTMPQAAARSIRTGDPEGVDPSPLGAEQAFWLFAAAWVAGSADRLDWLRDNLQALRRRLEQGRAVNLYLPSRDAVVEVRHPRRLDRWKATHFPGL